MNTHLAPRLLIPMLAFVLVVAGFIAGPAFRASAIDNHAWSVTDSQEDVLVQSCDGYDLTTNYTVDRNYHLFTDYDNGLDLEQIAVSFTGAIGNASTGKSYAYDGRLTRWTDNKSNDVTITDLQLRFEVGTPGQFSIESERFKLDLDTDPVTVIKTFVPNALQMELCYLLADASPGSDPDSDATTSIGESSVLIPPASYESAAAADDCVYISIPGIPLPC